MSFTRDQIEELKAAGADYVADALANGCNPDDFDGQSEAVDIARGFVGEIRGTPRALLDAAADWVYEGMVEELKRRRKMASIAPAVNNGPPSL